MPPPTRPRAAVDRTAHHAAPDRFQRLLAGALIALGAAPVSAAAARTAHGPPAGLRHTLPAGLRHTLPAGLRHGAPAGPAQVVTGQVLDAAGHPLAGARVRVVLPSDPTPREPSAGPEQAGPARRPIEAGSIEAGSIEAGSIEAGSIEAGSIEAGLGVGASAGETGSATAAAFRSEATALEAVTDGAGRFALYGPARSSAPRHPEGTRDASAPFYLLVERSGFAPALHPACLPGAPVTIALDPPAELRGRVLDESGRALAASLTLVRVWPAGGHYRVAGRTATDASGRYRFDGLAAGHYLVEARANGRSPTVAGADIAAGARIERDLTTTRARGPVHGEAVPGEAESSPASPALAALGLGRDGATHGSAASGPNSDAPHAGERTPSGRLHGIVVDVRGSEIAGAGVFVRQEGQPTRLGLTDERGAFALDGLGESACALWVEPPAGDLAPERYPGCEPESDAGAVHGIGLANVRPGGARLELVLPPALWTTGRVVDASGRPAAGVRVVARGLRDGVLAHDLSRADGTFRLRLPAGTRAAVRAMGGEAALAAVPAGARDLELVLQLE